MLLLVPKNVFAGHASNAVSVHFCDNPLMYSSVSCTLHDSARVAGDVSQGHVCCMLHAIVSMTLFRPQADVWLFMQVAGSRGGHRSSLQHGS